MQNIIDVSEMYFPDKGMLYDMVVRKTLAEDPDFPVDTINVEVTGNSWRFRVGFSSPESLERFKKLDFYRRLTS